ncbi:MAG: serine/threonine protein kinase [Anaerolineales bacterium]|nr:serine/threonine protein kinase [Anaerolineales bacterium]
MADWTGRQLGKVLIKDLIAHGGMAEIYTGIHETQGLIAIKVMRGLLERDVHQLARFKREADVVGELRHPNIVRMIDYVVEGETPCLIMDYIPGPSLAVYLKALHERNQRIPIVTVAQLLRAIASGLDYAHSKGVIHRDIKPANVLLRSRTQEVTLEQPLPLDVEPILTDFGLARLLDSTLHTTTGSVSGTPTYMSPEQSRGEKVDKRTDIYSLGVVLYEMLAGHVPFQSDSTFGMLMRHINDQPPPIKGISADLQALIDRALAKDPSLRYQSAGAMASEFLIMLSGQNISPDTRYFADVARKAVEPSYAQIQAQDPPPQTRFPWKRIAVEMAIALVIAFIFFSFFCPCMFGL